jgi:hypothetical protein
MYKYYFFNNYVIDCQHNNCVIMFPLAKHMTQLYTSTVKH